jgi:hypothetical protein
MRAGNDGDGQPKAESQSELEPRFQWDMVTWIVIALVIVLGLLFMMEVWPHRFPIPE